MSEVTVVELGSGLEAQLREAWGGGRQALERQTDVMNGFFYDQVGRVRANPESKLINALKYAGVVFPEEGEVDREEVIAEAVVDKLKGGAWDRIWAEDLPGHVTHDCLTPSMVMLRAYEHCEPVAQVMAVVEIVKRPELRQWGVGAMVDGSRVRALIAERLAGMIVDRFREETSSVGLARDLAFYGWWHGFNGLLPPELELVDGPTRAAIKTVMASQGKLEKQRGDAFDEKQWGFLMHWAGKEERQVELTRLRESLREGREVALVKPSLIEEAYAIVGSKGENLMRKLMDLFDRDTRVGALRAIAREVEGKYQGKADGDVAVFNKLMVELCGYIDSEGALGNDALVAICSRDDYRRLLGGGEGERDGFWKREALLVDLIAAKVSGDTTQLREAMWDELVNRETYREGELAEGENEWGRKLKRVNILQQADGTSVAEMEVSLGQIYGQGSVAMKFFESQGLATDTKMSWFVGVTGEEAKIFNEAAGNNWLIMMDRLVSGATGMVGMGHGFGADRRIWRYGVGELLEWKGETKAFFGPRQVGVALSTKGAEGTVAKKVGEDDGNGLVTGRMDVAAVQIVEALGAVGMIGPKNSAPLIWVGHSMGGKEALLLPFFLRPTDRVGVLPITPVVSNKGKFLKLLHGMGILTEVTYGVFRGSVSEMLVRLPPAQELSQMILRNKIVTGDEAGVEGLGEGLEFAVQLHAENLLNAEVISAMLYSLVNEAELSDKRLAVLGEYYKNRCAGIIAGGADAILDTGMMTDRLQEPYGERYEVLDGAPHYLQLTEEGRRRVVGRLKAGFERMRQMRGVGVSLN